MFRIKICGVTTVDDARMAADAGADAIGLNFFNKSRRFVTLEIAREIAASLPSTVAKVGVFVNHSAEEISQIVDHVGLDCIQLHGDEPANFVSLLPAGVPVVRAWRPKSGEFTKLADYTSLADYFKLSGMMTRLPAAILIDAPSESDYGGTGQRADWDAIASHRSLFAETPLILAGGLTPENVAQAIVTVRPDGVDVSTGVEYEPGRKQASAVLQFVTAAREAFGRK